jgi:ech hydrogenase subunit E
VLEDEKVVDVVPSIGYVHRGLEKLVERKDYVEFVYVAERICGICSFIHGLTYCMAVEAIMGIEVPPRAHYLRVVWSELSRLHSHLMWLGLTADALGFESLFMHSWRLREKILDLIEETTGGRVIFGSCRIGGVRRDVDAETLARIVRVCRDMEKEVRQVGKVFLNDSSVKHRMCGVGVLSREQAHELGAVGPMVRASGMATDTRQLGYAAYGELDFEPVVETAGDCHARCAVRIRELSQAFGLISQAVARMPPGEIAVKVTGAPSGEYHARAEQPRGEVVYYVKGDGGKLLKRFRIRTPTFANLPALVTTLKGCDLPDVPVLVLTIDPCISCMER